MLERLVTRFTFRLHRFLCKNFRVKNCRWNVFANGWKFAKFAKLKTCEKLALYSMDRTMDLIMDWTVKDYECWRDLWQGLHLDYTGSYAYFHHQHRRQCLRPILTIVLGDTNLSQWWIVSASIPGPQPCPQEVPTYNKHCTWLHDKELAEGI